MIITLYDFTVQPPPVSYHVHFSLTTMNAWNKANKEAMACFSETFHLVDSTEKNQALWAELAVWNNYIASGIYFTKKEQNCPEKKHTVS